MSVTTEADPRQPDKTRGCRGRLDMIVSQASNPLNKHNGYVLLLQIKFSIMFLLKVIRSFVQREKRRVVTFSSLCYERRNDKMIGVSSEHCIFVLLLSWLTEMLVI
jgi:hypothetical protein